jgi:hypothetical protein
MVKLLYGSLLKKKIENFIANRGNSIDNEGLKVLKKLA